MQPRVRKYCETDIKSYCSAEMERLKAKLRDEDQDDEDNNIKGTTENPLQNEVITCLRKQYLVRTHMTLSQSCKTEVKKLHYRLCDFDLI